MRVSRRCSPADDVSRRGLTWATAHTAPARSLAPGPSPVASRRLGSLGDTLGCDAGHPPVYVAWDAEVRGLWDGSGTPARVSHIVLTPRASGALSPAVRLSRMARPRARRALLAPIAPIVVMARKKVDYDM